MVHPQAGHLLEEGQYQFAVPPAVDEHVEGAQVGAVGGQPQQMRRDTVELAHQHADPLGAPGDLYTRQSFHRKRKGQLVEERCQVVHARHVGGALVVHQFLARLLHARVQVTDDRLGPQHLFAPDLDHHPQDPVRGRVRGPEVEDHGLVVGRLIVDVVPVEGDALGKAQHAAHFGPQFPDARLLPLEQLLGTFGRLGLQ